MRTKRILALVLSLAMIVSTLPAFSLTAAAEETATTKSIMLGTDHITGGQTSNVYFGRYQQTSIGTKRPSGTENVDWIKSSTAIANNQGPYYSKDPVKWRVLKNADGKLFLISDQNLDLVRYHEEVEAVTWETSTIRSWLNGYDASSNTGGESGNDYTSDNFINSAFSAVEKGVIADTTVINATYDSTSTANPNPSYKTSGGNNTTDKVFLLSIAEANNTSYFADNNSRIATCTAYVYGGGKNKISATSPVGEADYWWLRSPGSNSRSAAYISNSSSNKGGVNDYGYSVSDAGVALRPAFNLNLSSVLFTSAAEGGKPEGFNAVSDYTGNEYKLTLLDESRNFAVSDTEEKYVNPGGTLSLDYSNAKTEENEYISAMITDENDKVLYYGQLEPSTAKSGTVELTVPSDIELGEYTLKVFNEQMNGDYKTDLSSAFADIPLIVTNLILNTNGGTINSGNLIYYTEGETTTLPTDVTKYGHVFDGWYENEDFTGDKVTEIASTETGDKIYYAKWIFKGMITSGTDFIADGDKTNLKWDYVYYGTYNNEPIKWRVLSKNGNDGTYTDSDGNAVTEPIFLLSEYVLNDIMFDNFLVNDGGGQRKHNEWQNSDAQAWCRDDFAVNSFSSAEKNYVLKTTKTDASEKLFNVDFGTSKLKDDTAFFISAKEASDYLGSNIGDEGLKAATVENEAEGWWLRSPNVSSTGTNAGYVSTSGGISHYTVIYNGGTRPAFNLNLSSVLFTSAAEGGKPEAFGEVSAYNGNEWKLTMLDENRNFAVSDTEEKNVKQGDTVSLDYTGAKTGENEYISAMLTDENDEILYYGYLEQPTEESGTVEFTVPFDIEHGEYTLKVFNEQINGDKNTDFSSDFTQIPIAVHGYENNGICSCGEYEPAVKNGDVYEISNAGQLLWFAECVNNGSANAHAVLTADINLTGISKWKIIETYGGVFDGMGHSIIGLNKDAGVANEKSLGFIKNLNGTVKNVTFDGAIADGQSGIGQGIIAYNNSGTISGCLVVNSDIKLGNYDGLGFIAGKNLSGGVIENCGAVNSTISRRYSGWNTKTMGGITESNNGTVRNCYVYGCTFVNGTSSNGALIASGNAPENSYYYTTYATVATYGTSKTAEQFASGEVTYLLNGGETDGSQVWYQTLIEDDYPVFEGKTVYYQDGYYNYIVTLDGNVTGTNDTIILGIDNGDGTYSLPDNVVGYYMTLGEETKLLDAGKYEVSGGEVINTVNINVSMVNGAQVRYSGGLDENGKISTGNGLRFVATVDRSNFDGVGYGMKITVEDSDRELLVDAEKWQNTTTFSVAITDMAVNNYNREYTAVPYVTVKYTDGTEKTICGTLKVTRSVYYVAAGLLKTGNNGLDIENDYGAGTNYGLQNVLNAYVNMVGVRLSLAKDGTVTARTEGNGAYTGDVFFDVASVDNKDGSYTITVTPVTEDFAYPVEIMSYWDEFIRINNNHGTVVDYITDSSVENGVLTFTFTVPVN